jgi:hypothetical protein
MTTELEGGARVGEISLQSGKATALDDVTLPSRKLVGLVVALIGGIFLWLALLRFRQGTAMAAQ